jgi:hypothetical protein
MTERPVRGREHPPRSSRSRGCSHVGLRQPRTSW